MPWTTPVRGVESLHHGPALQRALSLGHTGPDTWRLEQKRKRRLKERECNPF